MVLLAAIEREPPLVADSTPRPRDGPTGTAESRRLEQCTASSSERSLSL
jgi:hypothetical protein